ncbi:MAG TPA: VWA domain-containing protein, partial [Dehalococcoidia bacterium]|nr:VWA domain-containing protein [Dehalococcoidia bacterium]
MAGAPLTNAAAAGRALVSQLGPSDQAAVIAFSNAPAVVQPFTGDKAALTAAIDGLVAGGNTSLYAAVQESVRLADTGPLPRRAIVLLSDGQDFGALSVDPQAALASVQAGSAVFMSIGLGDGIDQEYLAALAAAGRGQFRAAPTPEGLTALYQETAQVLRQQYVVTFDAAGVEPARAHGKAVQVRVTVGDTVLTAEATLALPPALLVTPVPTAAPPSEPVSQAQPASESSGSALPLVLLGAVGVAAAVGGATVLSLRRRRSAAEAATAGLGRIEAERFELETKPMAYPTIQRVAPGEPGAWLELADRRFPLGDSPVTVGYTSDCMVPLLNGAGSRTERVRIWLRDGSYMLHNLSRTGSVTIAGQPVTWAVLEDGDEIRIGGQTLVFRAAASAGRQI